MTDSIQRAVWDNKKFKWKIMMLQITNLTAAIDGKDILRGVNLTVKPGEIHAIMGPNGSGKSTLSYVLAGRAGYRATGGTVTYNGQNLLELEPDARAALGVFLAFQYPVELPGVPFNTFLKTSLNAVRKARGEQELTALDLLKKIKAAAVDLGVTDDMLKRMVNVGASGGEKKRNDILQMALLQPTLAILDETDSGLDIDALKIVADGVNKLRSPDRSFVVITHYQRLLDYIVPDHVHILSAGKIVRSGGPDLARELEAKGYGEIIRAA
jgi:Fe-S cluster assembly ATP-binding protein